MVEQGIVTEHELEEIHASVDAAVEEAIRFAKESPEPDESELLNNLFV